jgi:hypothetical protein
LPKNNIKKKNSNGNEEELKDIANEESSKQEHPQVTFIKHH